jgi:asparagine synthase (glutamine-hydrolysing)
MCGIAGIWRFKDQVSHDEIRSFTDSMYHRGPDGAGYEVFEKDNLALGHRRLSILDLSDAGKQPMSYADQRYWLSFNGEVYNFIEIRKELIAKGYAFVSESDSEVVLAAYIEWGTNCFKKFNGMWAIAIWDSNDKTLLLSRDRFGVKPLHYFYKEHEFFAFASETVAFRHIKGHTRSYNQKNLLRAMHAHNCLEPAGETIYTGIHQLLAGSLMIIKHNKIVKTETWWKTLDNLPSVPEKFEDQKERFLELLSDACKLRLRSDVSVASALSGGIDSTAVYCMLAHVMKSNGDGRVAKDWQKAFSIAFPGSDVDERKYIESVLRQTNGNGMIVEPTNDNLVAELQQSTSMSDFISGTPLPCLTYVYKAMHQNGIVVSMDGHGVDEYIYGYQSSVISALMNAYITGQNDYAKVIEDTLMQMNFPDKGQQAINTAKRRSDQIMQMQSGLKFKVKQLAKSVLPSKYSHKNYTIAGFKPDDLYNSDYVQQAEYPQVYSVLNARKNLGEQQLLQEFHYNDLPYNLRDFDRGAMQHQIEIRMPFMDYRLVTYTMALPQKSKLNNGYTKHILRESLKGIMPEDIRTRKLKIGLGAPLADWFNGPLNAFLLDTSHSQKLSNASFLNAERIRNMIEANCKGRTWTEASAHTIWPVLNYLLLDEN